MANLQRRIHLILFSRLRQKSDEKEFLHSEVRLALGINELKEKFERLRVFSQSDNLIMRRNFRSWKTACRDFEVPPVNAKTDTVRRLKDDVGVSGAN